MRDFDDFLARMLCHGGDGGDGGGGSETGGNSNTTGSSDDWNEASMGSGAGAGGFKGGASANGWSDGNESPQDYYESQMGGPKGPGPGGAWTSSGSGLGTFGDAMRGEMGFGQWAMGRGAAAINYDPGAALANLGFNLAFPGLGMVNSALGYVGAPTFGSLASNAYASLTGPNNPTGQNISSPTDTPSRDPATEYALNQDPARTTDVPAYVNPQDNVENYSNAGFLDRGPSLIGNGIDGLASLSSPSKYPFVRYRG